MYKKGRGGVGEEKCETTEVLSKHELRLGTNLHPKQERGS